MFRLVYENRLSCLRSVCRFLYNSLKIGVASVLKKRRYGSLFELGTLISVPLYDVDRHISDPGSWIPNLCGRNICGKVLCL